MNRICFRIELGLIMYNDVISSIRSYALERGLTFEHSKGPGWLSAYHTFVLTANRDISHEKQTLMKWLKKLQEEND